MHVKNPVGDFSPTGFVEQPIFYPSSFFWLENALLSAVTIIVEFVCKRLITGWLLSEEQFLSKDSLDRYLELSTERIHRGFELVA